MSDSYENYPVSITELRGLRDTKPASWTPRDVLIHMLRELDSGAIKMDHVIVCHSKFRSGGGVSNGYAQGGKLDPLAQMGLLHQTAGMMLLDGGPPEEEDEDSEVEE